MEQANNARTCTDDLSRVAGKPPGEGGVDDASADGEAGALPDGNIPDVTVTPPPPDTGTPDTFVPPPPDTGAPDAGDE